MPVPPAEVPELHPLAERSTLLNKKFTDVPGLPALPERPGLLNEKFKVYSYDGGSQQNRVQYDVKHVLIPTLEPFHCSDRGSKFSLVLECAEDFTLTHFYVSGPGPRCTEPIRSGLVWVTDTPPEIEDLRKYDDLSSEELCEVVKGLRAVGTLDDDGLPEPCVYFTTGRESREAEVELSKWREGRYVVVKFLDTHFVEHKVNVDVGMVALIGHWGRHARHQAPYGPWMRRAVQQIWVHPKPMQSTFSMGGWVCDGRDFTGGCRSGFSDFHQTNVFTVRFHCSPSGFDLCEKCAFDPFLGRVTDASLRADLEALGNPSTCRLAVNRLRNQWRRHWLVTLPKYFEQGVLDVLVGSLQRSMEGSSARTEDDRPATQQRTQHSNAEPPQKGALWRMLLQLTTELTQRLVLGQSPGSDVHTNDLVWALCPEPEEHWDRCRVVQVPKVFPSAFSVRGVSSVPSSSSSFTAAEQPGSTELAGGGGLSDSNGDDQSSCFLVSWRDWKAPCRVQAQHLWKVTKMTVDEDVMMATTALFSEVSRGRKCDLSEVHRLVHRSADLMAANAEGCTALLGAVRSECSADVLSALLESRACPDVPSREGITPLQHVQSLLRSGRGTASSLQECAHVLQRHGATPPGDAEPAAVLEGLREAFGRRMLGALLALQPPAALPLEVLEVVHLLLRELPLRVVERSLEPPAFRTLCVLLQHFVGNAGNLSTAMFGCRIMRALASQPDAVLQYLVRSHGAVRWAHRLASAKDFAQCGLCRQPQHEKVTADELTKEARALRDELREGVDSEDPEEWQCNAKLVEIATGLNVPEDATACKKAVAGLRRLLKRTERGVLADDRCTAYELEMSGILRRLLQFLKHGAPTSVADPLRHPASSAEHWEHFKEVFGDQTKETRRGLTQLLEALHAVVEIGESFPVWRHKKERGLKALTEPILLKLRYVGGSDGTPLPPHVARPQVSVMVEPLVPVGELLRYLVRVTPTANEQYLAHCHKLVGATISEKGAIERAVVLAFEVLHSDLPLPIHTIRSESTGQTQRVLLGMREHLLASPARMQVSMIAFRIAVCRLHVIGGTEAFPSLLAELSSMIRMGVAGAGGASCFSMGSDAALIDPIQQVLRQAASTAMNDTEEALSILSEEQARIVALDAAWPDGDGSMTTAAEIAVDPSMRVHTVTIAISDEIPLEVFWPMVREDITGAVREFYPRGMPPQVQEALQSGTMQNGVVPIAHRLSLEEAETLAARVAHLAQTAVTVDSSVVQELQRERSRSMLSKTLRTLRSIPVCCRVQFSPKGGDNWVPGVVVGHGPPTASWRSSGAPLFDVIDDRGALWERLPWSRVRIPAGWRELASSGGAPIQAVLPQAGLPRSREHARLQQEEGVWANAENQAGSSAHGASSGAGASSGSGRPPQPGVGADVAEDPTAGSHSAPAPDRPGGSHSAFSATPTLWPPPRWSTPAVAGNSNPVPPLEVPLGDVNPSSAQELVRSTDEEATADERYDEDGDVAREDEDVGERHDEPVQIPPLGSVRHDGSRDVEMASLREASPAVDVEIGSSSVVHGDGQQTSDIEDAIMPSSMETGVIAHVSRASSSQVPAPPSGEPVGDAAVIAPPTGGSRQSRSPGVSAAPPPPNVDMEVDAGTSRRDRTEYGQRASRRQQSPSASPVSAPGEKSPSASPVSVPGESLEGETREGIGRESSMLDNRSHGHEGASSAEEASMRQGVGDPQLRRKRSLEAAGAPEPSATRQRRDGGQAEDLLSNPMANLLIRMGGGGSSGHSEGYQIHRSSGNQRIGERSGHAVEALRGDFPAFARAADTSDPTSLLGHPVVERYGAADLKEDTDMCCDEALGAALEVALRPVQLCVRLCLHPPPELRGCTPPAPPAPAVPGTPPPPPPVPRPPLQPIALPQSWNLLKAMQYLHDQQHTGNLGGNDGQQACDADATTALDGPPVYVVRALQKVPLENWSLGYTLEVEEVPEIPRGGPNADDDPLGLGAMSLPPAAVDTDMDLDASQTDRQQADDVTNTERQQVLDSRWGGSPPESPASAPSRSPWFAESWRNSGPPSGRSPALTASRSPWINARSPGLTPRSPWLTAGYPPRKRRRALSSREPSDEVAREMYSYFAADCPSEACPTGPRQLIAKCGENAAVSDAIELLHLLRTQGLGAGAAAGLWVSSKLDRKLRYQLEDPLSVVSGTLPLWATTLPRVCPFLFSLETRKMLLKYTAFGPSFAVHWTQESKVGSFLRRRSMVPTELNAQTDPQKIEQLLQEVSNIEEHVVKSNFWLGALQSTLVRMQKGEELLRQSEIAMELVATSSHLLEVQFDSETGFGSAVTQSFYVEVAQALQDRDTNRRIPLWVEDDDSTNSSYLLNRKGLMVRPLPDGPQREAAVRRLRFLGRLMGQALREGFIVPLPLAEDFFALVLGEPLGAASFPRPGSGSTGELCGILADFASELSAGEIGMAGASPEELAAWRKEQGERTDFGKRFLSHEQAEGSQGKPMSFNQFVSLVGACFLETGLSGSPLCPGGEGISISVDNLHEFIEKASAFWFDSGVSLQVEAFRAGLNDVFPFECLMPFSCSELREMLCGEDRVEWDEQALLAHLHPVGGLTHRSATYKHLVSVLLDMSQADRSRFLDFVTSCPRLPPGGMATFHVDVFPDPASEQGFPRSRACANQLYLPPYSSKEALREKLHEAMHCSAGHHEQPVREA